MAGLLLSTVYSAGLTIVRKLDAAKESADEGRELAARVDSALELLQKAVPAFENDASFRKSLVQMKNLFEDVDDLLSLCLASPPTPSVLRNVARHAKRVFFSEQHLQALKDYSAKLDSLLLDLNGPMHVVAKEQQNRMAQQQDRMEAQSNRLADQNNRLAGQLADGLQAIQITLAEGTDPTLKLAKRHLKGNLIEEELVEFEEYLGSGSFGKVVAGEYYGKPVAIKRALKEVLSAEDRESFRREASTHFALRHDRIVQVIAFRTGEGSHPPCLVMELMDRTLYHFLGVKAARLDLAGCLGYIIDICEGIKYLHQSGVLHRDIKSHNILLHKGGAKVSDFGLAHVCSTIGRSTGNGRVLDQKAGTKFWMPPEAHCYRLGPYSYDSDIFSLHVVMWEIVEHVQGGRVHEPEIGHLLLSDPTARLLLTREEGAAGSPTSRLHRLIGKCGSAERGCRPKIGEVLAEANEIFDSLSGTGDGAGADKSQDSLRPGRETGGESLRPSAARRQFQEDAASDCRGGSWEGWRELNFSVVLGNRGGQVDEQPGLHRGARESNPTGPASAEIDRGSEKESPKPSEHDPYEWLWGVFEDGRTSGAASVDHPPEVAGNVHDGTTDEETGMQEQVLGLVGMPPPSPVGPRGTAATATPGPAEPDTNSAPGSAGGVPSSPVGGPTAAPQATRETAPKIMGPSTGMEENISDATGASGASDAGLSPPMAPGSSSRIFAMSDTAREIRNWLAMSDTAREMREWPREMREWLVGEDMPPSDMPPSLAAAAKGAAAKGAAAKGVAATATPGTFAAGAAAAAAKAGSPAAGSPVEVSFASYGDFGSYSDAAGSKGGKLEADSAAKAKAEEVDAKAKAPSAAMEAKAAEEAKTEVAEAKKNEPEEPAADNAKAKAAEEVPSEDGMGSLLGTLPRMEDSTNEALERRRSMLKEFHKVMVKGEGLRVMKRHRSGGSHMRTIRYDPEVKALVWNSKRYIKKAWSGNIPIVGIKRVGREGMTVSVTAVGRGTIGFEPPRIVDAKMLAEALRLLVAKEERSLWRG